MRTRARGTQDRGRMETRPTQLLLELDGDLEPVTGRIGPVGGERRPFTGYASLIAAIQSIRSGELEPGGVFAAAQGDRSERS
jgi:hypothetical protein